MKYIIKKYFIIFLTGCSFILSGTSDSLAAQETASRYKPSDNICFAKGKIRAVRAPIFTDSSASTIASYVDNVEVLCKCKLNDGVTKSKKEAQKASYAYPNGQWVQLAFPNAAQCDKSGINEWKTQQKLCTGFTMDKYDQNTQDTKFDSKNNCWFWVCKQNLVFSAEDKTKCVAKDNNAEHATSTYIDEVGNSQTVDVYPLPPCDTKTPLTVTLNGVKKIVPSNSRVNGICVPTCQSDMASSIDTSDPTQFTIYLQK